MPTFDHFAWISAALAVAALAAGVPGLVALVLGRRKSAARRDFPPVLPVNDSAAPMRTPATQQWLGLWDCCPAAWPGKAPDRDERTCSGA